ncbi:hypothetical protein GR927_30240 [Mycolicibacterium sp. 3033]|nr:hypothetical protein [Mycolicibacterium aurantiacum]
MNEQQHDEQNPDTEDAITDYRNSESANNDPAPTDDQSDAPEAFPRSYVEELRQENGKYRQRAQLGEAYAQRLHTELVRATGRLADPTDLPYDAEHLDDPDKLSTAVDDLLARKPHLASRRPTGDIGQGATASAGNVDLAALLRQRAG